MKRFQMCAAIWAAVGAGAVASISPPSMEWVSVAPAATGPRVSATESDAGLVLTVRAGEADAAVVASDAGGREVAIKALGAGRYLLPTTEQGVLTIRARGDRGGERTLRVYAGDFGAALRLLATEKPGGTVLEKEEWGQWLRMVVADWREQRLRELMEMSISATGPFAGAAVEDYLYLLEVTEALKAPDLVRAYRGKELPIRVELPAEGDRKAARFDALLRLPGGGAAKGGATPLLVRVHGSTRNPSLEGARLDVAKIGWEGEFPFTVLSPVCNKVMREENWDTAELASLVELVREKLPVDGARVFLTGFSKGGQATLKLANERPDLFTAWAAVCGWGDVFDLAGAARRPGWLIHGDRDPVVLPYESVRVYRMLRAMGAPARLTIYTGIDHNAWDPAYRQANFYEWLLAQRAEGGTRPPVVASEPPDYLLAHETTLTVREALEADTFGKRARELFALHPAVPLVGELTLFAPEGLGSPEARCHLGVPVKGEAAPPGGFRRVSFPGQGESKAQARKLALTAAAIVAWANEGDARAPMSVRIGAGASGGRETSLVLTRFGADER